MAGFTLFGLTHHLLTASMRLRGARHELLTANIANADTPGYRPRDIDFAAVMGELAHPQGLSTGNPEGGTGFSVLGTFDFPHAGLQPSSISLGEGEDKLDRNSVDIDRQISVLTENSLLYEASLTLLTRTLAGLRYAIGEGRR